MCSLSNKLSTVVVVYGCLLSGPFLTLPCSALYHRELWELHLCGSHAIQLGGCLSRGWHWQRGEVKMSLFSRCFRWCLLNTYLLHGTIACQTFPRQSQLLWAGPRRLRSTWRPQIPWCSRDTSYLPCPTILGEWILSCAYSSLGWLCWASRWFCHLGNNFLVRDFLFWHTWSSSCFIGVFIVYGYNSIMLSMVNLYLH